MKNKLLKLSCLFKYKQHYYHFNINKKDKDRFFNELSEYIPNYNDYLLNYNDYNMNYNDEKNQIREFNIELVTRSYSEDGVILVTEDIYSYEESNIDPIALCKLLTINYNRL
jgi:hypothetical protein